jgi:hypothetical protein
MSPRPSPGAALPAPGRPRSTTDVDPPANVRAPRPTESSPLKSSLDEGGARDDGDFGEEAPREIFAEAPPPPAFALQSQQYAPPPSQPPQRITQKTMSAPPPPPPSLGAAAPQDTQMRAEKPKPMPELTKRPAAPASRFVPFWLTVLILALLIALIAWWLAS